MLTALVNRQRSTSIAPCVERLRDASALMIRLIAAVNLDGAASRPRCS